MKVLGSEAGAQEKQEKGKKVPELGLSNNFSDGLRKGRSPNPGAPGVHSAVTSEPGRARLEGRGVEETGSEGPGLVAAPEELQGALLDQQQELQGTATATPPCPGDSPGGAEPAGGRDELTGSDFSIERGHRVTEISPSFSLGAEGSFSIHLAHPNFQSTPGLLLRRTGKAEGRGALVIPPDLQASPLPPNEETSGKSSAPGSLGKQHLPQSAGRESCDRVGSLKLECPQAGRMQALPSLSFLEKVGAWNVSQPEQGPGAASSGLPGASPPGRRASSAPARPSSSVLLAQKSLGDAKGCAAPPCREPGSLGSLHFPPKGPLLAPALSRSQSDNAINVCSRSRAWALQPPGEQSPALAGSDSTLGGSRAQKFVPGSLQDAEMESNRMCYSADVESHTRRSSAPDVFVSSVAQLLKKGGSSPADEHKDCEEKENQSLNPNIPTAHDIVDTFGGVSLDSLNFPVDSGEPREALGSSGGSLGVSRHCPSAGGDSSIPPRAALETPKKEEFNIEERIPVSFVPI